MKLTDEELARDLQALDRLRDHFHQTSIDDGWYTDLKTGQRIQRNVPEMLALIHSETSEVLEGYRKNSMDEHLPHLPSVNVESGDVFIRMFDFAGYLKIGLADAIWEKSRYNARRADHKIENRIKADGKRF